MSESGTEFALWMPVVAEATGIGQRFVMLAARKQALHRPVPSYGVAYGKWWRRARKGTSADVGNSLALRSGQVERRRLRSLA